MFFSRAPLFIACFLTSLATLALESNTEYFEKCHNSCNAAFLSSALETGYLRPEEVDYATSMMQEELQKKLEILSPICTEADFQLMADAFCFHSQNNNCRYYSPEDDSTKPIDLPPFGNESNAPAALLNLIGDRKLAVECLQAFPR